MKTLTTCFAALMLAAAHAQEMPEMPKPVKEHEWLQKFVGEWDSEMECMAEPGKPPMKGKSSEKARMLGGFWLISEGQGEMMGETFTSVLTLGYDPEKKKFTGTWVDSMTSTMWNYTGTLDEAGTTLTLETEGPCPMQGGKICKFKETVELTDKDHKTFTSRIQAEDGTWTTMMTMKSERRK